MLPKDTGSACEEKTFNPQENIDEAREAIIELLDVLTPIISQSLNKFCYNAEDIRKCLKANANFADAQMHLSKLLDDQDERDEEYLQVLQR
jgi:hypothetical protein